MLSNLHCFKLYIHLKRRAFKQSVTGTLLCSDCPQLNSPLELSSGITIGKVQVTKQSVHYIFIAKCEQGAESGNGLTK
jgi:hypothetical protein